MAKGPPMTGPIPSSPMETDREYVVREVVQESTEIPAEGYAARSLPRDRVYHMRVQDYPQQFAAPPAPISATSAPSSTSMRGMNFVQTLRQPLKDPETLMMRLRDILRELSRHSEYLQMFSIIANMIGELGSVTVRQFPDSCT
jgi:hypothetical protein